MTVLTCNQRPLKPLRQFPPVTFYYERIPQRSPPRNPRREPTERAGPCFRAYPLRPRKKTCPQVGGSGVPEAARGPFSLGRRFIFDRIERHSLSGAPIANGKPTLVGENARSIVALVSSGTPAQTAPRRGCFCLNFFSSRADIFIKRLFALARDCANNESILRRLAELIFLAQQGLARLSRHTQGYPKRSRLYRRCTPGCGKRCRDIWRTDRN